MIKSQSLQRIVFIGGDDRDRTDGLSLAKAALFRVNWISVLPRQEVSLKVILCILDIVTKLNWI